MTVFVCDPDKNIECRNRGRIDWCGLECFCTQNADYAKQPVQIIENSDQYNEERITRLCNSLGLHL